MRIIFLGDVFGKPGRQIVLDNIAKLKLEYDTNILVLNGENLADGKGLTEKTAKPLFDAGVTAMTSGNHLWDRNESHAYIESEPRIIKPLNYPQAAYGKTFYKLAENNTRLIITCLSGQLFMGPCDSPYTAMDNFLNIPEMADSIILTDFHAESTAEKRAFGHSYNGIISAFIGTHTHIQTADEEILSGGTAYITDAGMTGPHDSVIGIKKDLIIEKMKTGMPIRYEVANSGLQINGVFLEIDPVTRKANKITRIRKLLD